MIVPYNTNILIMYEEEQEKRTESGIYVPPSVDGNAFGFLRAGIVLEVNKDCTDIKKGDTVLFNKNAVADIPTNKVKKLIRTEDVYAVIPNETVNTTEELEESLEV